MRVRFLFLLMFAFSSTAMAGPMDFIEGQMKYKVLETGKKDFTYSWDEAEHLFIVRMGLDWEHFQTNSHAFGFDLNNAYGSDLIFPYETVGCRFQKSFGQIPGAADLENNEVFIQFKGETCREDMLPQFNLANLAIHFYNVLHWGKNDQVTGVFRLQMYDGAGQ